MKLSEFKLLADTDKIETLYREGSYIGKRKIHGCILVLYQYEGFYVEIFYHKYRTSISSIQCFTSIARLDPYLDQMDINNLVDHHIK